MIIGNLNKGDYTVASFKLQRASIGSTNGVSGANPSGMNPARNSSNARNFTRFMNQSANMLTIQIVYTNTLGERETVEKTIQVLSSSNSTSTGAFSGASGYGRNAVQQSFFSKYK
jgi:hypothetical protein